MHFAELGLLLDTVFHVRVLFKSLEWVVDGVFRAEERLVICEVVLGVFVPTQELNGIVDVHSSFLVILFFKQ